MALILCIETSTQNCSVCLARDGETLQTQESFSANAHAAQLVPMIESLFTETKLKLSELDAVAVSEGPGSYTGLRIGVSTAKGLCYALGKKLIAVNPLHALAHEMHACANDANALYLPLMDARREDAYTALFDARGHQLSPIVCETLNDDFLGKMLKYGKKIFVGGNAVHKFQPHFFSEKIALSTLTNFHARYLKPLAEASLNAQEFANVAYFEPFYLKEFQAKLPKRSQNFIVI